MIQHYSLIVIGVSAGGVQALEKILPPLPANFSIPIAIVLHLSADSKNYLSTHLNQISHLTVKEAEDKEPIKKGFVYLAPPNYHLLIEDNSSFSLSCDEKVSYARPSIDVLFETAADSYRKSLIGIVLTGANQDGSQGLKTIQKYGGYTVVQSPEDAEVASMPQACLEVMQPNQVLKLDEIKKFLNSLTE